MPQQRPCSHHSLPCVGHFIQHDQNAKQGPSQGARRRFSALGFPGSGTEAVLAVRVPRFVWLRPCLLEEGAATVCGTVLQGEVVLGLRFPRFVWLRPTVSLKQELPPSVGQSVLGRVPSGGQGPRLGKDLRRAISSPKMA